MKVIKTNIYKYHISLHTFPLKDLLVTSQPSLKPVTCIYTTKEDKVQNSYTYNYLICDARFQLLRLENIYILVQVFSFLLINGPELQTVDLEIF